jgi:hypothetical protein
LASARPGFPAYNILVEGPTQALENDVVLSMKQGNVAAPSRIVHDERIERYFKHHGHRTAVSQRALQAHADPWLGYTEMDGVGFVVSELSPYVEDIDWSDFTEPEEMSPVLDYLGRATAKVHCVADEDSDATIVGFQTEDEIVEAVSGKEEEFVKEMVDFGMGYSEVARDDHRLFVDAFATARSRVCRVGNEALCAPDASQVEAFLCPPSSETIDGDRKEPRPSTLDERHGPTPAAAGALNLMGKQATLKPVGRRILSRLASFSIWQYSRSIPAKRAFQMTRPSPVSRNSLAMSSNFGRTRTCRPRSL